MVRVKRSVTAQKKKRKLLKAVKGYKWGRKSKYRAAKEAFLHAGYHAFASRKIKKRDFRGLWQVKINAACREKELSYSKFINLLKKNNVGLDRKVLAELAETKPAIFGKIVEKVITK